MNSNQSKLVRIINEIKSDPCEALSYNQEIEHTRTHQRLKTKLVKEQKKSRKYKSQIKKLSRKLEDQLNDFQTVAENSPDVICRFSKTYHHLYVNPALEKSTGIPLSNFIGKTPHQAGLEPDFANFWVTNIKIVFDKARPHSTEFSFPSPDGEKFFQTLLVPEFSHEGEVVTVLTMTRDITDFKLKQDRHEELLGIASHELKTPITSLKMFSQLLHSKFLKQKDHASAEYLVKMQNQIDKLNHLVNDLLDATRISNGKLKFTYQKFNFDKLVADVAEEMQRTSSKHEIIIKGETNKYLIADKNKIGQVLINLLSNAIKYSPDEKKVIIQLIPSTEGVMCWVQDFGVGISLKDQQKIFERFYRADEDEPSIPGLGLGLYISAEIINHHGGKIWVDSEKGRGSTFCFTLPSQNLSLKN